MYISRTIVSLDSHDIGIWRNIIFSPTKIQWRHLCNVICILVKVCESGARFSRNGLHLMVYYHIFSRSNYLWTGNSIFYFSCCLNGSFKKIIIKTINRNYHLWPAVRNSRLNHKSRGRKSYTFSDHWIYGSDAMTRAAPTKLFAMRKIAQCRHCRRDAWQSYVCVTVSVVTAKNDKTIRGTDVEERKPIKPLHAISGSLL